jgi:ATP-dependent protease ClpP protease subunit
LSRRKGGYDSIVDGKAYSGGSVIAVGGRTISMQTGSWMMIHEARGTMQGTAADFRDAASHLDSINDQLVKIYTPRWKGTEKELRNALNAETWMRDHDAVAMGLADSVDGEMRVAAYVDPERFGYRNVPDAILQMKPHATPRLAEREAILDTLRKINAA